MMAFGQHRTRIWSQNNALIPWISLLLGYLLCLMGITEALAEVFPEFSEQPQSQVFSHHSPVTLRCAATPEDAQIRWLFNGQPLDERRHTNLIVQGSNLHFSYIHRHADQHSDLGEYRCTATTSLGTVISQPAILSKPVLGTFSPSPDVKVTVPEGGYATLTCDPPASNPPAKVVFQTSRGDFVNTTRGEYHIMSSSRVERCPHHCVCKCIAGTLSRNTSTCRCVNRTVDFEFLLLVYVESLSELVSPTIFLVALTPGLSSPILNT
ncbi:cell adhesion molecule-related/down-regulated by oncogenes [Biomphalaria glabrata]